jgi:hypothetical protein
MTNIAPSILIPLEIDITQPIEPARDRVEKLERKLAAVEARRRGVTENIIYMAEREMQRIRQEGRDVEAAQGPPKGPRPSMTEGEVDWMMANIAAPCPPGKKLNIVEYACPVGQPLPGTLPNREAVSTELLYTVQQANRCLDGYSAVADEERKRLLAMKEREQQRLDKIGKRPDEDVEMTG